MTGSTAAGAAYCARRPLLLSHTTDTPRAHRIRHSFRCQQLTTDLALYGVATGSLTVACGSALYLYGRCCIDLIVEHGGTATILGTVAGSIINRGTVILHGLVQGSVHAQGAHFEKSPASAIGGTLD